MAQKQPNELGLYDMSGNVWEWCRDWYNRYSQQPAQNPLSDDESSCRVIRGGSYHHSASSCRTACRDFNHPNHGLSDLGLRLVLLP